MKCCARSGYEINERRCHTYPYFSLRVAYTKLSEKKKHLDKIYAIGRNCHSIRIVPVKNNGEWASLEMILPGEKKKPKNTLRITCPINSLSNKSPQWLVWDRTRIPVRLKAVTNHLRHWKTISTKFYNHKCEMHVVEPVQYWSIPIWSLDQKKLKL